MKTKVTIDKDNDLMFMECTSKDGSDVSKTFLAMLDAMQEAMN